MSMEELQQMKQEIGTKAMDKILGLSKKPSQDNKSSKKKASSEAFKRENKNRPRETSSKKTVGRFRYYYMQLRPLKTIWQISTILVIFFIKIFNILIEIIS